MRLTRKQKQVVECMRRTGGRISEMYRVNSARRRPFVEVLTRDPSFQFSYNVAMTVKTITFRTMLKNGVIKYMPQLTETREDWHRSWYELADEYK